MDRPQLPQDLKLVSPNYKVLWVEHTHLLHIHMLKSSYLDFGDLGKYSGVKDKVHRNVIIVSQ